MTTRRRKRRQPSFFTVKRTVFCHRQIAWGAPEGARRSQGGPSPFAEFEIWRALSEDPSSPSLDLSGYGAELRSLTALHKDWWRWKGGRLVPVWREDWEASYSAWIKKKKALAQSAPFGPISRSRSRGEVRIDPPRCLLSPALLPWSRSAPALPLLVSEGGRTRARSARP